jgi:hypothetical protein
MKCTAAPRFEEKFPESTSEYAEEGRLAHALCELKVLKKFTPMSTRTFNAKLNKIKSDQNYADEMKKTSDAYIEHLVEKAMTYDNPPYVAAEVKVGFEEYVPEGFGTCDCVMIGGDTLNITDYKHGKGVPVSAEGNAQMRLYALGALKRYMMIYGDRIKRVCVTIFQPRTQDEPDSETLTVEDLMAWGETVKPIAQRAFSGFGEFVPGDHCRFCRGKAQCRARADQNTALEDFKDCVTPAKADSAHDRRVLTNAEIGDLLIRGQHLAEWLADLEEYALNALLNGETVDGWKAVAGRSNRAFSDQDKALDTIKAAGYDEALIYERKPKSLTELEKLMGKKDFADKLGTLIVKPLGKPTLAPLSDKREPYNSAAADFAGVT